MSDERVGDALKRAAEPVMRTSLTEADDLRAGWAEAVRVLSKEHGTTSMNCCAKCDAIRAFCDAILGGSDE